MMQEWQLSTYVHWKLELSKSTLAWYKAIELGVRLCLGHSQTKTVGTITQIERRYLSAISEVKMN